MEVRDLFSDAPLPADKITSLAVQQLLREPINVVDDWQRAESLLRGVDLILGGRIEVKIALYKMFAYSNRHADAEQLILQVLKQAGEPLGWSDDWRALPGRPLDSASIVGNTRMYLYSLKALGFVSLRSGQIDQAIAVLHKLQQLDPHDEVGGSVVQGMANSLLEEDD